MFKLGRSFCSVFACCPQPWAPIIVVTFHPTSDDPAFVTTTGQNKCNALKDSINVSPLLVPLRGVAPEIIKEKHYIYKEFKWSDYNFMSKPNLTVSEIWAENWAIYTSQQLPEASRAKSRKKDRQRDQTAIITEINQYYCTPEKTWTE